MRYPLLEYCIARVRERGDGRRVSGLNPASIRESPSGAGLPAGSGARRSWIAPQGCAGREAGLQSARPQGWPADEEQGAAEPMTAWCA